MLLYKWQDFVVPWATVVQILVNPPEEPFQQSCYPPPLVYWWHWHLFLWRITVFHVTVLHAAVIKCSDFTFQPHSHVIERFGQMDFILPKQLPWIFRWEVHTSKKKTWERLATWRCQNKTVYMFVCLTTYFAFMSILIVQFLILPHRLRKKW